MLGLWCFAQCFTVFRFRSRFRIFRFRVIRFRLRDVRFRVVYSVCGLGFYVIVSNYFVANLAPWVMSSMPVHVDRRVVMGRVATRRIVARRVATDRAGRTRRSGVL